MLSSALASREINAPLARGQTVWGNQRRLEQGFLYEDYRHLLWTISVLHACSSSLFSKIAMQHAGVTFYGVHRGDLNLGSHTYMFRRHFHLFASNKSLQQGCVASILSLVSTEKYPPQRLLCGRVKKNHRASRVPPALYLSVFLRQNKKNGSCTGLSTLFFFDNAAHMLFACYNEHRKQY